MLKTFAHKASKSILQNFNSFKFCIEVINQIWLKVHKMFCIENTIVFVFASSFVVYPRIPEIRFQSNIFMVWMRFTAVHLSQVNSLYQSVNTTKACVKRVQVDRSPHLAARPSDLPQDTVE